MTNTLREDAERLLQNIACSTQDRSLLMKDNKENPVMTEAIIINSEKALQSAFNAGAEAMKKSVLHRWLDAPLVNDISNLPLPAYGEKK